MDRNSPESVEKIVPDVQNAISLKKDCEEAIFCGLPVYSTRMLSIM